MYVLNGNIESYGYFNAVCKTKSIKYMLFSEGLFINFLLGITEWFRDWGFGSSNRIVSIYVYPVMLKMSLSCYSDQIETAGAQERHSEPSKGIVSQARSL